MGEGGAIPPRQSSSNDLCALAMNGTQVGEGVQFSISAFGSFPQWGGVCVCVCLCVCPGGGGFKPHQQLEVASIRLQEVCS